jgi:hypothetical protein
VHERARLHGASSRDRRSRVTVDCKDDKASSNHAMQKREDGLDGGFDASPPHHKEAGTILRALDFEEAIGNAGGLEYDVVVGCGVSVQCPFSFLLPACARQENSTVSGSSAHAVANNNVWSLVILLTTIVFTSRYAASLIERQRHTNCEPDNNLGQHHASSACMDKTASDWRRRCSLTIECAQAFSRQLDMQQQYRSE